MNKPIIRNWMRYCASVLAISGMLVMGACGNDDRPVEETETIAVETVDRPVAAEEYADDEVAVNTETEVEQTAETTAPRQWSRANWGGSSANINTLLDKFPEVNNAIRTTLASMTSEPGEYNMPGQARQYTNSDPDNEPVQTASESTPTYDRMSNTASAEDADAAAQQSSMMVYDIYMDPAQELTEQERMMLEEARTNMESRRGEMDEQLTAYYLPAMEARPDVNYSELIEEIKEETILPQQLKDANMEGTVLVQFVVDEQGEISEAEVIDGVISQMKEDGTLMSFIRLSDRTQSEIKEEINKEDLLEYKGEGKEMIIEAVKEESLRLVNATSGKWQSAQQDEKPVKMVMVLPIRFTIED